MDEIWKRKQFQRVKNLKNDQFWIEMDTLHTVAYELAVKHYTEAGEITLTPKQQKALHQKAEEIREIWDGLKAIKVEKY